MLSVSWVWSNKCFDGSCTPFVNPGPDILELFPKIHQWKKLKIDKFMRTIQIPRSAYLSIWTSVPSGAPTSWFGTFLMRQKHRNEFEVRIEVNKAARMPRTHVDNRMNCGPVCGRKEAKRGEIYANIQSKRRRWAAAVATSPELAQFRLHPRRRSPHHGIKTS